MADSPTLHIKTWLPVFEMVTDGDRRVLKIVDWMGGIEPKPDIGLYYSGWESMPCVPDIASALDIASPLDVLRRRRVTLNKL